MSYRLNKSFLVSFFFILSVLVARPIFAASVLADQPLTSTQSLQPSNGEIDGSLDQSFLIQANTCSLTGENGVTCCTVVCPSFRSAICDWPRGGVGECPWARCICQ